VNEIANEIQEKCFCEWCDNICCDCCKSCWLVFSSKMKTFVGWVSPYVNIATFLIDLYSAIYEPIILWDNNFQSTQYVIYNNSYVIDSNFLIYDRTYAQNLTTSNPSIAYSSIANYTSVTLNSSSSFDLSVCSNYTTRQLEQIKTIYQYLPGAYTLLVINIFNYAAIVGFDIFNIVLGNIVDNSIFSFLISCFQKVLTSQKLGFSFFQFDSNCLNLIEYYDTFYYVYLVYGIAYVSMVGIAIFYLQLIVVLKLLILVRKEVKAQYHTVCLIG